MENTMQLKCAYCKGPIKKAVTVEEVGVKVKIYCSNLCAARGVGAGTEHEELIKQFADEAEKRLKKKIQ